MTKLQYSSIVKRKKKGKLKIVVSGKREERVIDDEKPSQSALTRSLMHARCNPPKRAIGC